jgi:hypothetical protein
MSPNDPETRRWMDEFKTETRRWMDEFKKEFEVQRAEDSKEFKVQRAEDLKKFEAKLAEHKKDNEEKLQVALQDQFRRTFQDEFCEQVCEQLCVQKQGDADKNRKEPLKELNKELDMEQFKDCIVAEDELQKDSARMPRQIQFRVLLKILQDKEFDEDVKELDMMVTIVLGRPPDIKFKEYIVHEAKVHKDELGEQFCEQFCVHPAFMPRKIIKIEKLAEQLAGYKPQEALDLIKFKEYIIPEAKVDKDELCEQFCEQFCVHPACMLRTILQDKEFDEDVKELIKDNAG